MVYGKRNKDRRSNIFTIKRKRNRRPTIKTRDYKNSRLGIEYERGFKKLERELVSFTIDIFASKENKKLDNYRDFLIHKDVLDLKIDTWKKEKIYCCPPISMITTTTMHIIKYKLKVTLVVPKWEGNLVYPIIQRIKLNQENIMKEDIIGDINSEIWRNKEWNLIAVKVDG
jgi:hypothetical protein